MKNPFFDVDKNDPLAPYILAGVEEGVMFAFLDGTFRPDQSLTVAQAVSILSNNDIIDASITSADESLLTRSLLADILKDIVQYNERIEFLLDWEKGYALPQRTVPEN